MTLQHEMERVGRLLAYDRNLRVDVRGTRAYSVPGRIVIPNAESYAHLGVNSDRMLHAILDHECGHARWTDHNVMGAARQRGGESLAIVVNCLEDARIEKLMGAEFKGCGQNLHIKNRWFWEDAQWRAGFKAADGWTAFCIAFGIFVRHSVTLDEINDLRPDVADLIKQVLPYVERADRLVSSDDALKLGIEMWEALCKLPPPPKPEPDDEDSDDDEQNAEPDEGEDEAPPSKSSKSKKHEPPSEDEEDAEDGEGGEEDDGDQPKGKKPDSGAEDAPEGDEDGEDEGKPEEGKPGASEPQDGEDDEGSGDGGDASEDEGEDSEGDRGEGGDSEGESEDGGGEDADHEEDGEGDGSEKSRGIIDPYRAVRGIDLRKAAPSGVVNPEQAVAKLMEEEYEKGREYRVFSHEFDIERDFHRDPQTDAFAESHYDDPIESIEKDALIASSAITQAFEVALRARQERRPVSGNDEGEVDLDIFGEFAVGAAPADTIYRQFVAEDERDVTVAIMLDCSGSMGAPRGGRDSRTARDFLSRRVAYALSTALKACSIDHEITGFTTLLSDLHLSRMPWALDQQAQHRTNFANMRNAMIEAEQHGVNPALFARELLWGGVRENPLQVPYHAIFKPYGVSDLRGLKYAHGIANNLDGEAVLWQARRLASRPERRRVMFVLSDGMPAGARDPHVGAEHLIESVKRALAAGIEVYGIGIETDAVKHFYPRYWIARSLEQLMDVAFTSFVETLTAGRTESACVQF